jgi:hypothetical protein
MVGCGTLDTVLVRLFYDSVIGAACVYSHLINILLMD